jgi:DNA polymerase-4
LFEAKKALRELYEDWRLRFEGSHNASLYMSRLRGAVVKLKYTDFKSTTCEHSLRRFPQLKDFEELLDQAWARRESPIRLLGLGVRLATSENENAATEAKDDNQLAFW